MKEMVSVITKVLVHVPDRVARLCCRLLVCRVRVQGSGSGFRVEARDTGVGSLLAPPALGVALQRSGLMIAASERRGNYFKGLKDFYPARGWGFGLRAALVHALPHRTVGGVIQESIAPIKCGEAGEDLARCSITAFGFGDAMSTALTRAEQLGSSQLRDMSVVNPAQVGR